MASSKKSSTSPREEVLRIYGKAAERVANEQVRLSLEAEDEGIRAVSGRHIMGMVAFPDGQGARQSLPAAAVQVISNIHLPEYRMPGGPVSTERVVVEGGDVVSAEVKPRKLIEPAIETKPKLWHKDIEPTLIARDK